MYFDFDQVLDSGDVGACLLDTVRSLIGLQLSAGVTPVTFLLSGCGERDSVRSLELAADLPTERGLVGLDGQSDVGALPESIAKKR